MLSPDELYPAVLGWAHALAIAPVGPGEASVANLVTALLSGQSLRSAALERAQVSARTVRARQRYKRVASALTGSREILISTRLQSYSRESRHTAGPST